MQETDGDITGASTVLPGGEDVASCKRIVPLRQKVRTAPRFGKSTVIWRLCIGTVLLPCNAHCC